MADTQRPVLGGRYELYRRIARGGMAEVFLARDQLLDRPVAVKVLFPEFATDPQFVERFRREAQAAANLNQPNVVGVYDWGQERGTYYIVMEYVEGRSLAEIIRSEGPLHPDRAADIAIDIAGALAFAHRNGVVHRDIKPGNVLITNNGQVKVTDFGIARAITGSPADNLTQAGSVMGTATYLSPEQAQGRAADPRTDVYSLAVVLYEMLASGPPFTGETPVAIAYKHVQEAPVPPSKYNADVPDALEAITLRGLAKQPEQRYASAEDFRADLRRFRTGEPVAAMGPIAGAGAAAAAAAAAGAALAPGGQQAPPGTGAPVADRPGQPAPPVTDPTVAVPVAAPPVAAYPGTQVMQGPPATMPPGSDYDDEPPPRTWLWVLALVVLLIILAVLLFLFWRALNSDDNAGDAAEVTEQIVVPDVTERRLDAALALLRDAGFTNIESEFERRDDVEANFVFDQDPTAGREIDADELIVLSVSEGEGLIEIPNVTGLSESEARSRLEEAGFRVNPEAIRVASDDVPEGNVVRQIPPAGEERPRDTLIDLEVSSGVEEIPIPDLTGEIESDARVELARLDPTMKIVVESEPSSTVEINRVIRTEPPANATVARGGTVTLYVSSGPEQIEIPTLESIGSDDPAVVEQALQDLGFTTRQFMVDLPAGDPNDGKVLGLVPSPGTSWPVGDEVLVRVGRAALPPSTTTTTTTTAAPTTTTAPPTTTSQP